MKHYFFSGMMKLRLLVPFLLVITSFAFAQEIESTKEIEKTVNANMWKPFKAALESRDWKTYTNLHTDDILRVNKWGIRRGLDYKNHIKQSYQKEDSNTRTFDLWLESRSYLENIGYEVGYYRMITKSPDGKIHKSYGRFHVVLKKVNGEWKIAQDWDTEDINGVPITSKDFKKGTPLIF
ncbi:MAG: nuclear transport factor 2 family protein [Pricia sp.]|nr:nuclear transport factor 2 family protein [Pricia sp.]